MQYMNGHAPQIGDIIEVPNTGQRLTVTAIPQAGIISCGNSNLRAQGCALLVRSQGASGLAPEAYSARPGTFGGVDYSCGYGQSYVDPGLELLEDILIMDTVVDLVEDIVDFGGGFGGDFF